MPIVHCCYPEKPPPGAACIAEVIATKARITLVEEPQHACPDPDAHAWSGMVPRAEAVHARIEVPGYEPGPWSTPYTAGLLVPEPGLLLSLVCGAAVLWGLGRWRRGWR